MAAPQIPNLLQTGRKTRTNKYSTSADEKVLQRTDDDAAGSRQSAVNVGYLTDDFADTFSPSKYPVRRMPIINRGTYVRTTAIDYHVNTFIETHANQPVQIISIGAGSDTRPFRLLQSGSLNRDHVQYVEVDFPATTLKKIKTIKETPLAFDSLNNVYISVDQTCLTSSGLSILAMDLCSLASSTQDSNSSGEDETHQFDLVKNLDPLKPMLLIAECCLTYLSLQVSNEVLTTILSKLSAPETPINLIQYDPIQPHDAFGKTMISNLSARNLSLPGLEALPMVSDHQERLSKVGFNGSLGVHVRAWWDNYVSGEEKTRLQMLEGLDEEEEWILLADHYAIICAWRNTVPLSIGPII